MAPFVADVLAHKAALTELAYTLFQDMVVAFQCVALSRRERPLSHASSRLTSRFSTPSGGEREGSAHVWGRRGGGLGFVTSFVRRSGMSVVRFASAIVSMAVTGICVRAPW